MTQQDQRSRQLTAAGENQPDRDWRDDDWFSYGKSAPPTFSSQGAGRRASVGHVGVLVAAAVAVFAAAVAVAVPMAVSGPAVAPPVAAVYPGDRSGPLFPHGGTSGARTLFLVGTVSAVSGTSVTIAVHGRVLAPDGASPATFTAVITGYSTRPPGRVLPPGPSPDPVSRMALGQGKELWTRVLVVKDDEVTVTAIVTGHRQATDLPAAPRIRSGR